MDSKANSKANFPTLKDKVAIVTGSSRGIGAGIALELARRGAKASRPILARLGPKNLAQLSHNSI
jgi:NAD(P)-dependent dehydrogenase (short-subunit alcohol dehydrogenase family)